jgi:ABC-type Fe3+-siderophore transport system permease subunit
MRDKEHRVLATVVLVLGVVLAYLIFNILRKTRSTEVSAIIAFSAGILIVVGYQLFNFKNLQHKTTKINSLTQIWLGLMLVVASIFILILSASGMEFATALMWMAGIVLAMLFLSIKKFDEFLEKKI